MYHDFFLLSRKEYLFSDYSRLINDPRAVQFHDDVFGYILDTLLWIPTYAPASNKSRNGLCRFGPTIIHAEGATAAEAVFGAWATLFAVGPSELWLTGGWETTDVDMPTEKSGYAKMTWDRDELIGTLRLISSYAKQVVDARGECYILHLGI